jgi:DNA gyrase subunit A
VLLQPRQGLLAQGLRAAPGRLQRPRRPIVNLLPLEQGERINATLPVPEYEEGSFVFMATSKGTVKKTPLSDFSPPLARGIIAIDLHEDEHLIGVAVTDGRQDMMLFHGSALRASSWW